RRDASVADRATAGAGRRRERIRRDGAPRTRRGDRLRRPPALHAVPGRGHPSLRPRDPLPRGQAPRGGGHGGGPARRAPGGAAVKGSRRAGLLLYRHTPQGLEVLLGHMGGPFFRKRDAGAWTVPKGEYDPGEPAWEAARREFQEELGLPPPEGEAIPLGEVRQAGGKTVTA